MEVNTITKRKITLGYLSILCTVSLLALGLIVFGLDAHVPLAISTVFTAILAIVFDKQKWSDIEKTLFETASSAMSSIVILFIIGMIIGSWIQGGIVASMIYYGLDFINPKLFLFTASILSALVSLSVGSSWTTAGTIGVALIGIASALGISVPMTAGAIISGAYFGDKLSPLSDTTNLAPAMSGANLFDHISSMSKTTVPVYVLVLLIYLLLGLTHSFEVSSSETIIQYQDILSEAFNITYIALIPPLLVVVMVVLKVPAIPGLIGSVFLGSLFALVLQSGNDLGSVMNTIHYGYEFDPSILTGVYDPAVVDSVNELLTRGGLDSMQWTISLIIIAMVLGGMFEATGFLEAVVSTFTRFIKTPTSLVTTSIFTGIFINIVIPDQYIAIIFPGKMYKDNFEELGLHPSIQSRVLETGGTITSPLVPWNTCGATMSSSLGVPTVDYLPFAFFNLLNPLFEILFTKLGYAITYIDKDNSYKESK